MTRSLRRKPNSASALAGTLGAGRPELARPGLALLVRRPQLLARLRLLDLDRLGVVDEQIDCLAQAQVVTQHRIAAGLAQALQQLFGGQPLPLARAPEPL